MPDKTVSNPKTRTKAAAKYSEEDFSKVKDQAEQMAKDDGARNEMFKLIDEMYLMTWKGDAGKNYGKAKIIISPDARNAAQGAVRLLVATDPIFNVVNSKEKSQGKTEKLEKAVNQMFEAAGRVGGNPIHYDLLLSAILYAEMHSAITSTASLVEAARQNNIGQARAERVEMMTPFLIDVWQPYQGHAEFDHLGMTNYFRETDTTVGKLRNTFGEKALPESLASKKTTDKATLKTFYDLTNTVQWTDEGVIIFQPHNLPFIPVMVQYTEGSKLWAKAEEARQPLLYTLLKSGMWNMQNLIYTVMYTLIRDMGVTPLYAHTSPKEGQRPLEINFDEKPGVVELVAGETFMPLMNKGLIDPAVQQGLAIATAKGQESTIQPQALGAPVEGDSTYSELALLSQSGRLPLIGTQRRGGWGIGQVMEMCLAMMKADGTSAKAANIDLKASDIPDYVQIDCKLDVKLPQDKLQQANIAQMITSGDNPLVSNEWARQNIINVGQSGDMDRQIWTEKAAMTMFQTFLQQQIQQAMAAQQPQPGQVPPTGQIPPEGQPMGAGPQMTPGQGEMVQGGLPPQMAGMMPGAGQAAAPEGM